MLDGLKASEEGDEDSFKKVIYSPTACHAILEYALAQGRTSGYLFQVDGEFISYRQIQYRYDQAFRNLKMNKSGTHVLRHGAGSEFDELNGGNRKLTAKVLGHKNTSTTEGYVRVRAEALQDAMSKMDEALQKATAQ